MSPIDDVWFVLSASIDVKGNGPEPNDPESDSRGGGRYYVVKGSSYGGTGSGFYQPYATGHGYGNGWPGGWYRWSHGDERSFGTGSGGHR